MIYQIEIYDVDSHESWLFEGPEVPNWQEFCGGLLEEAIGRFYNDEEFREKNYLSDSSYISQYHIVMMLKGLLPEKGYVLLSPSSFVFTEDRIIRHEDNELPNGIKWETVLKIIEHNKNITNQLYKKDGLE